MVYVIPGVVLLGLLILAAPISLGYDSGEQWLKISWLGLSLRKDLAKGEPKKAKPESQKQQRRGRARLGRLWANRDLGLELMARVGRFMLAVCRTLNFRESAVSVSLPDPMWNGLLFGVLSTLNLENVDLSVNFENQNFAKIRVTIYPYRVARQVAVFMLHLPYIRIMRCAWDLKKSASTA